jgi:hypothetical protein
MEQYSKLGAEGDNRQHALRTFLGSMHIQAMAHYDWDAL